MNKLFNFFAEVPHDSFSAKQIAWEKLVSARYDDINESLNDFYMRIRTGCVKLGVSNTFSINCFVTGLRYKSMQLFVTAKRPQSLTDALNLAKDFERVRKHDSEEMTDQCKPRNEVGSESVPLETQNGLVKKNVHFREKGTNSTDNDDIDVTASALNEAQIKKDKLTSKTKAHSNKVFAGATKVTKSKTALVPEGILRKCLH